MAAGNRPKMRLIMVIEEFLTNSKEINKIVHEEVITQFVNSVEGCRIWVKTGRKQYCGNVEVLL
jgi:hypothetical protein